MKKATTEPEPGEHGERPEAFDSFEEAIAALRSQLEPGASIDLHDEDCALAVDEAECSCVPIRLNGGAQA